MSDLAQALHAFQADAPPIHLDATNPHFRNSYASLGGVVGAVRPVLNKHGLVYAQLPTHLGGLPALRTVVIHAESGEELESVMPLILPKQDPQGYGSALTYARRYALLSILGLVGDEDDDANAATPQSSAGAVRPSTRPEGTPSVPRGDVPADPHGLQASRAAAGADLATDKQKALIRRLAPKVGYANPAEVAGPMEGLTKKHASAVIESLLALEAAAEQGATPVAATADTDDLPF